MNESLESLSEQVTESLDKKLSEFQEEVLRKVPDSSKLEKLDGALTSLEHQKQVIESLKAENDNFKSTVAALEKRVNSPKSSGACGGNEEMEAYAKSLDEYLRTGREPEMDLARKGAEMIYGEKNARDIHVGGNNGYVLDTKTMRVSVDPEGGYLAAVERSTTPERRVFETTPMRELASVIEIGGTQYEFILDDDEATSGGWVAEQETRADTATPKLGLCTIPVHEQYAQPKATQKMLDDGVIDVAVWLQGKVNDILTRTENVAFVTGDGSKKPRGFLTYPAWAAAATYERNALERVKTGVNDAITADSLKQLQDALLEDYDDGAVWLMNRRTFTVVRTLKDGNGQYLLNMEGLREGEQKLLLGKPIVFSASMPTSLAAGVLPIAYGNFNRGYQIVDRRGITVLRDPYTDKPYVKFYTTKRVGGDVKNFDTIKILETSA